MTSTILKVKNISYTYLDQTKALTDVSFELQDRESLGLVGENGAGKSTLLLLLTGCLWQDKAQPESPEPIVTIDDLVLSKKTVEEVRRRVGLVFQEADDQLFMPSIDEDLAFGLINQGLAEAEIEVRVKQVLAALGIEHLRFKETQRLSSGEKRLAAIAAVLVLRPKILIFDEPSSNLDPKARRNFINILSELPHTKIIASHDLDLIADTCEQTLILHRGRVLALGKTADLFADEALLAQANLEKPLSQQVRR